MVKLYTSEEIAFTFTELDVLMPVLSCMCISHKGDLV